MYHFYRNEGETSNRNWRRILFFHSFTLICFFFFISNFYLQLIFVQWNHSNLCCLTDLLESFYVFLSVKSIKLWNLFLLFNWSITAAHRNIQHFGFCYCATVVFCLLFFSIQSPITLPFDWMSAPFTSETLHVSLFHFEICWFEID